MLHSAVTLLSLAEHLRQADIDQPVHAFAPAVLDARLQTFRAGFGGTVTFAVKANPADQVLTRLWAGGLAGFDVASPDEMARVARLCPGAAMHYNNPVRSRAEIAAGIAAGVRSWAVDEAGELARLIACGVPRTAEIAIRFRLPVRGAAYGFGAKFGAAEAEAPALLAQAAGAGYRPALTFHVGTQCAEPAAFKAYVHAAARIAAAAGVTIERLNVGGGFPCARDGQPVDLTPFFAAIHTALDDFPHRPALVCEPGRGMVADAFAYAVPVKSIRPGRVYLADGIYAGLAEFTSMSLPAYRVLGPGGPRTGTPVWQTVFGPTCDSLDRIPGEVALPSDLAAGDWIVFSAMGAYLTGMTTRFNGYGQWRTVTVATLAVI